MTNQSLEASPCRPITNIPAFDHPTRQNIEPRDMASEQPMLDEKGQRMYDAFGRLKCTVPISEHRKTPYTVTFADTQIGENGETITNYLEAVVYRTSDLTPIEGFSNNSEYDDLLKKIELKKDIKPKDTSQ
jgi:hypothetical protein